MCLAIQQMREESEIKGAVEAYKELEISLADTIRSEERRVGKECG